MLSGLQTNIAQLSGNHLINKKRWLQCAVRAATMNNVPVPVQHHFKQPAPGTTGLVHRIHNFSHKWQMNLLEQFSFISFKQLKKK